MIRELDLVALRESIPDQGLKAGDVGTVVFVHQKGEAFEVEFINADGETFAIATLGSSQVRRALKKEIAQTRLIRA
jgi:Domain of unknown function (DUF4926)